MRAPFRIRFRIHPAPGAGKRLSGLFRDAFGRPFLGQLLGPGWFGLIVGLISLNHLFWHLRNHPTRGPGQTSRYGW